MLSRYRFRAGAFVGVSALLAAAYAQRSAQPKSVVMEGSTNAVEPSAERIASTADPRTSAPIARKEEEVADRTGAPETPLDAEARHSTRVARSHLRSVATTYGLETRDVDALEHRDTYVARDGGARVARFRQVVGGRAVLGREVAVIMNANDEVAGVTGRLASSTALRRAELAIGRAARSEEQAAKSVTVDGGRVVGDVRAVFFDRDGELVPSHQLIIESGKNAVSSVIVSAVDGATLRSQSLVHADSYDFRVYADSYGPPYDSPMGTSATPHPTGTPNGYAPTAASSQIVRQQNWPFSRNDAWLPPGATQLAGNSVFAYVDRAAPDGFDTADLAVPTTSANAFDYSYDPPLSPTASDTQSRAAATQLFFTTAFLHDWFYDAGFDEASGNAQASNFGRGGVQGDRLLAEAQDYDLANGSRAIIPPDGKTPKLSFGIYKGTNGRPDRDGAVDSTLVAHEWGHLLAERLVGDAIGLGNAQGQAISEGTADFVSLLVSVRPEDQTVAGNNNWQGVYAIGGYVASATDDNGHYYGLRRLPYSTDLTKDPLVFRHAGLNAALPTNAPIRASDPLTNASPHNAGEIWATALWECYATLLNAHPFQEAQDRMKRYLVAGLRAMPFEPTFNEAANAMVAAAAAADPADGARFTAGLTKRGFGASSLSAPRTSTDLVGITESYQIASVRLVSVTLDDSVSSCDNDGVLDVGETGLLRVTMENPGPTTIGAFTVTPNTVSGSAPLVFVDDTLLFFQALPPGTKATRSIRVGLGLTTGVGTAKLTLPVSTTVTPSNPTTQILVNYDETSSATTDTMSATSSNLVFERDGVLSKFKKTSDATGDFAHLDDGPSRGTYALLTPPMKVTSKLGVSFRMRHSFVVDGSSKPLDGAVVEISEDGIHFEDVTKAAANPEYGTGLAAGTTNPLGARPAWTGASTGFPSFVTRSLDLGNAYTGKTVVVRFRVGSAGINQSAYGLDIDDLAVTGIEGTPFTTRIAEPSNGLSCNRPPVADAGDDITVSQFAGDPELGVPSTVTLSAANSFDPDSANLTFAWTQLMGPTVTLSSTTSASTTFTVPNLTEDTMLVFRVAVSDGVDTSTDVVRVTVRHDNRAPKADAKGPASVESGQANVVLDGSTSTDPDNDPLTYTWTQTKGPSVALTTSGATTSFTAPVVTTETTLTFSLVVSDGIATSDTTVDVAVHAAKPDAGAPTDDAGVSPPADAGGTTTTPPPSGETGGNSGSTSDAGASIPDDASDAGGCAVSPPHRTPAGIGACAIALGVCLALRRRQRRS